MKKSVSLLLSLLMVISVITSVPITASAATQVDQIIAYAQYVASNNPHGYDGYCLAFCGDCYKSAGYPHYAMGDAYSAGTAWIQSTSSTNIPVGALVFYDLTWNAKYGHVGIYAGNGKMYDAESAYGGVKLRTFSTKGYRGWGWYGGVAPSGATTGTSGVQQCSCSTSYAGNYVTSSSGINLNIRAGHGTNYSVIGSIPDGTAIYISKATGTSADSWGHVTFNGISGYVCMKYVNKVVETTTYTISYNANGGTGAPASQTKPSSSPIVLSTTRPSRFGYMFRGWSTSSTATSATYNPGATFSTNANTTLYAVWEAAKELSSTLASSSRTVKNRYYYTITPEKNRRYRFESTGSTDSEIYIYNSSGTILASDDDSGSGYNFKLDYTFSQNTKYYICVKMHNDAKGEIPFTIKALWQVKYDANGGSGAPSTQTKLHNVDINLSTVTPSRSGYEFVGWSTSSTATAAEYNPGDIYSANGSDTLYAVWRYVHTHSYFIAIPTQPTCTQTGLKTYTCSCGDSYSLTLPATGHTEVKDAAVAATCTTAGKTEGSHCSVCNAVIKAQTTVSATGHTIVKDAAVAATCTTAGKSEGSHCSVCNAVIKAQTAVSAKGHTEVKDAAVAATCTTAGKTEGSHCSVCNVVIVAQNDIPAKGHTEVKDAAVAATCTTAGKTEGSHCSVCGDVINAQVTIDARGHQESTWYIGAAASVETSGYKYTECVLCGTVVKFVEIPQLKCSMPTLKTISNTTSGVKITWSKVSGADSYRVYRKTKGGSWGYIDSTMNGYFTDKTAKSGTTYYYTVKAKNEAGLSSYNTNGFSVKYVATPKLTKISNATGGLKLTWSKVSGADGYYVYRKLYGTASWTRVATIKKGTTVSYKDTKVSKGKVYVYSVKAYDGSAKSAINSTGIWLRYLAVPALKSAISTTSGIKFTWGQVTGAEGYYVYRKTGSGSWVKIATVVGNAKVTYTDKTARKGKTYKYTVRAYKGETFSYYNTKGLTVKDKY